MSDTIFHKIIRREIPADIVHEDEHLIAFRDIAPQAPVHVLFVPKTDFATLNDVPDGEAVVIGRLATAAALTCPTAQAWRSASLRSGAKSAFLPAATLPARTPFCRLTLSSSNTYRPVPEPLSA